MPDLFIRDTKIQVAFVTVSRNVSLYVQEAVEHIIKLEMTI